MIKYITITTLQNRYSKPGGHIQKSIQFKYVVYQVGVKTFVFKSI